MIAAISFAVLIITLASASLQDIRSREVSDVHWFIIGAAAVISMIAAASAFFTVGRAMICAGTALLLSDILYEKERPATVSALFYASVTIMFAVPALTSFDDPFVRNTITVPICFALFALLYFTGVVKGGADAKCLMVIAMLFPVYPELLSFPMIPIPSTILADAMPFAIAVLFHAAVFSVLAMIPIIVRNVIRRDTKMPNMFSGYRIHSEKATKAHVWVMNRSEEKDGKIWVTPKIPFIVPITAAALFVAFVGNVFFLL